MADPGLAQWFKGLLSPPAEQDPRFKYTPGEMLPSHVEQVPQFANPTEAQSWAYQKFNKLPVNFDYPRPAQESTEKGYTQAFQQIAPTLARAYQAGSTFPSSLNIQDEQKGGYFPNGTDTMGAYESSDKSLHLNKKFLYPGEAEQTVMHELGHASDPQFDRSDWPSGQEGADSRVIAQNISPYSQTHPDEFVAETYGQGALGRKMDDATTEMYRKMQGPDIPKLLPPPLDIDQAKLGQLFRSAVQGTP